MGAGVEMHVMHASTHVRSTVPPTPRPHPTPAPPPRARAQTKAMAPLHMLRAALHALATPATGLSHGAAMTPLQPGALAAAVTAAAPALLSPSLAAAADPAPPAAAGASASAAVHTLVAAACDGLPPPSAAPPLAAFKARPPRSSSSTTAAAGGTPGGKAAAGAAAPPTAAAPTAAAAAVLLGPTGHCNLAARLTRSAVAAVAAAAAATLAVLDAPGGGEGAVEAALLTPACPSGGADYVWAVGVGAAGVRPLPQQQEQQGLCGDTNVWRWVVVAGCGVRALLGAPAAARASALRVQCGCAP